MWFGYSDFEHGAGGTGLEVAQAVVRHAETITVEVRVT